MRVLIADDELLNLKLLEEALKKWGYDVITTDNGEKAWEILQNENAPNLIILDWMMPGIEGVEICKRIRSWDTMNYIYIILLTGKSDNKDIIKGLEAGADDYIIKPFNFEELKYRIKIGQRIVELEKRILKLASTDYLTGLLNRRAFMERMEAEVNRSRRQSLPLSIFIMDIDHFKKVNDSYGHQAGDIVLQQICILISMMCRDYDLIGRYGGEEFIACFPGANIIEIAKKVEQIRLSIEREGIFLPHHNKHINITASFGIAHLDYHKDETLDFLIMRADKALYQAKRRGRNRVIIFQEGM